jgi:hypothetical protein
MRAGVAALSATMVLGLLASRAHADKNDLVLSRLGDNTTTPGSVIPDNARYRSIVSELGVVLAPHFLTPADTLGFSGFNFSADVSYTGIDAKSDYWCATEEAAGCGAGQMKSTGMLGTIGLFVRKGIWLPLPSFEFGAGAVHLFDSRMWAAQAYVKFAVHEGFHDWPVPSLAVRGAASRLMGSEQLDLTVASLDVSVSKSFGVAGTVNLAPYAGWNILWIVPRSEVIDKTPNVDAFTDPTGMDIDLNFTFADQQNIVRQRLFGGFKLKYYVFSFSGEIAYALSGSSVDDRTGTDQDCATASAAQKNHCDAKDASGSQLTYTMSLAMDF